MKKTLSPVDSLSGGTFGLAQKGKNPKGRKHPSFICSARGAPDPG